MKEWKGDFMRKVSIAELILEVTRKCNMACAHCLRGDARDTQMECDIIPHIFKNVGSIDSITFSGGEPTLNVPFITKVVDYIIEHDIFVGGVFIATNAKIYSQEMVDDVRKLMMHRLSKDDYGVSAAGMEMEYLREEVLDRFIIAPSRDNFHEDIPVNNLICYMASGFYSDMKTVDFSKHPDYVIAMGRGADLPHSSFRPIYELSIMDSDEDSIYAESVYVNAEGDVYGCCDMSYDRQECSGYGNVYESSLADILNEEAEE